MQSRTLCPSTPRPASSAAKIGGWGAGFDMFWPSVAGFEAMNACQKAEEWRLALQVFDSITDASPTDVGLNFWVIWGSIWEHKSGSLMFWAAKWYLIVFTILLRWYPGICCKLGMPCNTSKNGSILIHVMGHLNMTMVSRDAERGPLGLKVDPWSEPGDNLQHPHQRFAESFELVPLASECMRRGLILRRCQLNGACLLMILILFFHVWLYELMFLDLSS